ncbi:MAG: DUF2442 domain-containing protein [Thermomicrobiales bacterium]
MRERAVSVRVVRSYVIEVTFADGFVREVDIEPMFWGEVFKPLRDPELFAQAAVDPSWGSVFWPTGADLAPEFLYHGEETPYGRANVAPLPHVASGVDDSR